MMTAFWLLVIIGGAAAISAYNRSQTRGPSTKKDALDVLKERYARGEISKEEYETKKRDVES